MVLRSLHILLTYQCTLECDHCFVWSSPWQTGTLTFEQVAHVLEAGRELGTVKSIYFEGGEPFLYYNTLVRSVELASALGFEVGIVSNGYWATSVDDAVSTLRPFVGRVMDLSLSNDRYHWHEQMATLVANARTAAESLGIPVGYISIAEPAAVGVPGAVGQLPEGASTVMYRGRAAEKLASRAPQFPAHQFTTCPYESLADPGRVHIDPLGYLHICQGISLGNLFEQRLVDIVRAIEPEKHPIVGPLLAGGPALLAQQYDITPAPAYADACQFCYETRLLLRDEFPAVLAPDQVYGRYG